MTLPRNAEKLIDELLQKPIRVELSDDEKAAQLLQVKEMSNLRNRELSEKFGLELSEVERLIRRGRSLRGQTP